MTNNIAVIGGGAVGSFLINFLCSPDSKVSLVESDSERFTQIASGGVESVYVHDQSEVRSCHSVFTDFDLLKDIDRIVGNQDLVVIATKEYDINAVLIAQINQITDQNSVVLFVQSAVQEFSHQDLKGMPVQMIVNAGLDFDKDHTVKLMQNLSMLCENGFPIASLRPGDDLSAGKVMDFFDDILPLRIENNFDRALYKKFMVNYGYGLPGVVEQFLKRNIAGYDCPEFSRVVDDLLYDLKNVSDLKGHGELFSKEQFNKRISGLKGHLNSNQKAARDGKMVENGINLKVIDDAAKLSLLVPTIRELADIFYRINRHVIEPSNFGIVEEVRRKWEDLTKIPTVSPSEVLLVNNISPRELG